MPQYRLDTTSLEKSIAQLKDSLDYCKREEVRVNEKLGVLLRAAAIQAFEFTYELSWKMLKRYLDMTIPDPQEVDSMSFSTLIRTGCEQGLLLSDMTQWKQYRHNRSITSHTYDQEKAAEVFAKIPAFLEDAQYLLQQINKRVSET